MGGTAPTSGDDTVATDAIAAIAAATERVLAAVRGMADQDVRAPSRLPGWSRGHVLTHLARNADGMRNLVTWVETGVETPMYASREARDADIDAGARRSAGELAADVAASGERLRADLEGLPSAALGRTARLGSGAEVAGRDLASGRLRELEIHHVDLDVGYTPAHWSLPFCCRALDEVAPFFRTHRDAPVGLLHGTGSGRRWEVASAGPELTGPESALLAWLTGRGGEGLVLAGSAPGTALPRAPRWV